MKKGKISFIVLIILCFFTNMSISNADTCSSTKLEELKQKAENIDIYTEFDDSSINNRIYDRYHITITGLTEGLYIYTDNYEKAFDMSSVVEGTINSYITTNVKKINIYSNECDDQIIKSIEMNLKKFNFYSTYKECEGISGEDLAVCSKFYDGELTDSVFQNEIKKYKESLEKEQVKNTNWTKYGIIAGSILLVVIIVIIIIRHKKNRLD